MYGDYRSIWNRHVLPHFGNVPLCGVTFRDVEEFLVREGRVLGIEGPPKTMSSCRDVDLLDPLLEILRGHRQTSPRIRGIGYSDAVEARG